MATNQIILPSKEAIIQAVTYETNKKYPEIKADDPRVIEHVERESRDFLKLIGRWNYNEHDRLY